MMADSKPIISVSTHSNGKRPKPKTVAWIEWALEQDVDHCILWPFAVGKGGYGNMWWREKYTNAHRVVCTMIHGEVDGMQAAHLCGNRLCCNHRHLVWTTRQENEAHKEDHGTRLRGDAAPWSRLTSKDVCAMRREVARGATQRSVAKKYGVSYQHMSRIIRRERWKGLT